MSQLGVLLWLLLTPTHQFELPQPQVAAPCRAARELTARGPCLRPEDCGAYSDWKRLFGAPRTVPLDPQRASGAARRPAEAPSSFLCLASTRSTAKDPGSR